MCSGPKFTAYLSSKNGATAGEYTFQTIETSRTSGSYTDIMITHCSKIGMKPLCAHSDWCKSDARAVYIGQDHGLHHPNEAYFPTGWSAAKSKFPAKFCEFTAGHGGNGKALCTTGGIGGATAMQTPAQNNVIMCAHAPPVTGEQL